MNSKHLWVGLCLLYFPLTSLCQTQCVQGITCADNKSIEEQGFDCTGSTCLLTISVPADALDIMIEVISKGGNAAESATVTPNGQSSFNIPLTDLPTIGFGHNAQARVGRACLSGNNIQSTYEVNFNGEGATAVQSVTFLIVRQASPDVICGGSSATVAGGYVFHGETDLAFTIPATTTIDPKTVTVMVPLSDVDADNRLIVVTATAGGVTDMITFDDDTDPHYRNFTLTLAGVPGNTTNVNVNFCSPVEDDNTLSCDGDGDSFVIGSVVVNAPCDPQDCNLILPMELVDFRGEPRNESFALSWKTASELNSSHFVVERAFERGKNFNPIASIDAKGFSNTEQVYQLADADLQSGDHFYRLKMVDLDGSSSYSQVLRLYRGGVQEEPKIIIQNPVNASLPVQILDGIKNVSFYSMSGQIMSELQIENETLGRKFVDVSTWPRGFYFARYHYSNTMQTEKFIVH